MKPTTIGLPRVRVLAMPIDEPGIAIVATRYGRIAFGLTLIAGCIGVAVTNLATSEDSSIVLIATWIAAAMAIVVGRRIARRAARRGLLHTWPSFGASIAAPSAGVGLALPLTLPVPIALAVAGLHGVNAWLDVSLEAGGLALVVSASLTAYRGSRIARGLRGPSLEMVLVIILAASLVPNGVGVVLVGPIVGACILVFAAQNRLLADSEHVQMA